MGNYEALPVVAIGGWGNERRLSSMSFFITAYIIVYETNFRHVRAGHFVL